VSHVAGAVAPRAVFVDLSGRRARRVRWITLALGAVASAYVVLVLLALVLPAGFGRLTVPGLGPLLPGPAAPAFRDAAGADLPPAQLLAPSAAATPPAGSNRAATTGPTPSTAPGRPATRAPAPAVPSAPTAVVPAPVLTAPATAAPSPVPTAPGKSGARPTRAATPAPRPTKP
jgi:hypothetical protein